MAEGTHRPGGEPPRSEQDLLADRRARRAAEGGDSALVRRAEVAEATVQALETHLASLQQRVRDAEEESRRMVEEIQAERSSLAAEPRPDGPSEIVIEYELRRARQRSHVERQLRIEAEDRYVDLERESRAENDRLLRRLAASEREVQELSGRLDAVQRELVQARELAAGRTAEDSHLESELHVRLAELEQSASEIQRGLEDERAARERSERTLEAMRESHRQVQALVAELRSGFAELGTALSGRGAAPAPAPPAGRAPSGEMADALAAAVVRLRERAAESDRPGAAEPADASPAPSPSEEDLPQVGQVPGDHPAPPAPSPSGGDLPQVGQVPGDHPPRNQAYKHSLSLIGRLRLARKQRRAAR
jgi:hypothetical protein